ncbi:MAG: hypothetical protein AABW81_00450 [Nanoarchaeota archaeon]
MANLEEDVNHKAYKRILDSTILYDSYKGKYVLLIVIPYSLL